MLSQKDIHQYLHNDHVDFWSTVRDQWTLFSKNFF